ncbi:SIMPL domain-containing protein [candidate division WOR-3 bacterium]|nr:SIMPL domain-containing protein [candidate division WOR-3 bacterium]
MKKVTAVVLAVAALHLVAAEVSIQDNAVSAEGYANLYVLADMAVINFTVEIREPQMSKLFSEAMKLAEELSGELSKLGIKQPLVTEGSGSIYSELDWESERMEHELSINLRCIIDDIGMLDKVVETIYQIPGKTPGRKISFYDVMYTLKDPSIYLEQLQKKALADARLKAQLVVQAYERSIGDIIKFSDSAPWTGYMWGPQGGFELDAEDMGGSSRLPRVAVGYSIMVTYELK